MIIQVLAAFVAIWLFYCDWRTQEISALCGCRSSRMAGIPVKCGAARDCDSEFYRRNDNRPGLPYICADFQSSCNCFLIPGILILVPGAGMYRTVYQFSGRPAGSRKLSASDNADCRNDCAGDFL